jgi:catechol 2,3-dioxygenase-like lactoylglutathione lyase family enzyme
MTAVLSELVVDASDPLAQARWWAEVLGWTVHEDDAEPDIAWIEQPNPAPGALSVLFARVPEAKSVKNRVHLDVRPADGTTQEAELARLLGLGATAVDVGQGDVPWHVLADPEGNEFCLLRRTPSEVAELEASSAT